MEDYINQLEDIKSYLVILPMLEDIQGASKELEHTNKSFMALKMCNIILNSFQESFKDMCWSQKDKHFPVNMKTFLSKLVFIKHKYLEKKGLLKGVHKNGSGLSPTKTKKAVGGNDGGTKRTLNNPIPHN